MELLTDPDNPAGVTLLVNGAPSSYLRLDDPELLTFEYMQQMAAMIDGLPAGPLRVVHLGAAGCSMARYVAARRPGSRQIGVDIDTQLLELVRQWFALPRAPELRLRAGDARTQLATMRDSSADVVIRDVFAPDVTPEHLTTTGFVREVRRTLAPGGLYLANIADRQPLDLVRRELATVRTVQPGAPVTLVAEPAILRGRRYGNLVLAAGFDPVPLDEARLDRALRCLPVPARAVRGAELDRLIGSAAARHDLEPEQDEPAP